MVGAGDMRRATRVFFLVVLVIGVVPVFLGWRTSLTAPAVESVLPHDSAGDTLRQPVGDNTGDESWMRPEQDAPVVLSASPTVPPALPRSTWVKLRILFQ
jgi:hypothetical protein